MAQRPRAAPYHPAHVSARRTPSVLSLSSSRSAPGHGHELPWPTEFLPSRDDGPSASAALLSGQSIGSRCCGRPGGAVTRAS